MKKCFYLLGFCIFLFLGACQEDEEVVQKEEVQLPTLEEMEVAYIAEESLNGWDAGISFKGGYCVGKCDTIDGSSILYINYPNGDINKGVTIVFNKDDDIINVIHDNHFLYVFQEGDYIYYTEMDNNGQLANSYKYKIKENNDSRSLVKEPIEKLCKLLVFATEKGVDGLDIFTTDTSQGVVDGNYRALITTLGFVAGGLAAAAGGASLPVIATIVAVDVAVDKLLDTRYENARRNLYGNAEISIVNVSNDWEKNYTVVIEITNANTIPSKYYEWCHLKEYNNTVECGVVASEKHLTSDPSFYHHEAITTVLLQPNINRRIITVTMPKQYYSKTITFRPFLVSDREYENKNSSSPYSYIAFSRGKYIRYGETYDYKTNHSFIGDPKQTEFDYESNVIKIKADVEVYNVHNIEWGLYVNLENGMKGRTPLQSANSNVASVQFTVPINDENLYLNYEKWTATYKRGIGVYHINEEGEYTYGEMKECEFVYHEKPNIKFTHAEIIGTREEKKEEGSRAVPNPDDDWKDDGDDDDKKSFITEFTQTFDIKGSLWIDRLDYVKDEGAPKFEAESGRPLKDGTYTKKGTIKYTAKMPNLSAITRYSITLKDGRQASYGWGGYYSNRLYWSGENKITDVDWE